MRGFSLIVLDLAQCIGCSKCECRNANKAAAGSRDYAKRYLVGTGESFRIFSHNSSLQRTATEQEGTHGNQAGAACNNTCDGQPGSAL